MGRLKKANEENQELVQQNNENFNVAIDLLTRISSNANDIKTGYYSLIENLNALSSEYAGVYNELKVLVKLPNRNDITDIAQFKDDIDYAVSMLSDTNFLSGLIK